MTVQHNEETYAVVEEKQDIVKGTLCYDVAMQTVFTSTIDASFDMPGLTGRNLVKL
ncbi:MAG TPA: hypothetical protein PK431_13990 [Chitinophagales bacterium]|nr:hypothetical protein [Chitinophagales bacterium]